MKLQKNISLFLLSAALLTSPMFAQSPIENINNSIGQNAPIIIKLKGRSIKPKENTSAESNILITAASVRQVIIAIGKRYLGYVGLVLMVYEFVECIS